MHCLVLKRQLELGLGRHSLPRSPRTPLSSEGPRRGSIVHAAAFLSCPPAPGLLPPPLQRPGSPRHRISNAEGLRLRAGHLHAEIDSSRRGQRLHHSALNSRPPRPGEQNRDICSPQFRAPVLISPELLAEHRGSRAAPTRSRRLPTPGMPGGEEQLRRRGRVTPLSRMTQWGGG